MPQLCSAIKGTNFKKEPIGPLGVEIKIKNDVSEIEKKLIECELSGMLSSFIVDNFEDRRSLDRLAKDIGCSINIITSKFVKTRHDISAGKCQSNVYSSIIDLLEISNDNVYNCLIDQKNVERVILIKRDAEARNVLSNQNTVPRNCKYALTGNFYQYYPVPLYRSYGMKNAGRQGPSKLGTDNNEILAGMIKEIEKNDKEIKIMTDELDKIHSTLSESEKELNKNNKTCQDCNSQIQKLDQEIFRLEQKNQSQKAPDMSALEEDKEKYEEQLEEIVQEVSQAKQKIESWAELMKEKLSEFKKAEKEVDQLNSKLEPMEKDQLLKIENQLIKRQTDRVRAEKKLEKINLKKVEINKTKAEVKERVEKLEERLRNDFKGEKIETDRPCHAIQKMIKAAEEALRVQRNTLEPSQVIKKNRVESYTKYTEANQNFEWLKDLLVKMIAMEKDREKGFFQVRGSMCRSVMLSFANHLQRRNFQGKLKFKHKAVPPTLDLAVDPIGGDPKKTNKRDMKTLSGGEKSFSTVSLVLAFWDVIPTPFRILDEFDVFMDMVNRRTALNMMIDYIKEKKNKQYVFLTPLNMNSVDASSEDLQIQYLKKTDGS